MRLCKERGNFTFAILGWGGRWFAELGGLLEVLFFSAESRFLLR